MAPLSRRSLGLLAGGLLLIAPAVAQAAPVTVQLRIEGPTRTLFEGPVTTDVRTFHFTGDATTHVCDGTAAVGGPGPTAVPTRGAALATAIDAGLSVTGTWSKFGASFSQIDGEAVGFDPVTFKYLVEYLDGQASMLGACGEEIHGGDEALFAYGDGSETLLKLTAPATVAPGQATGGKVTNRATGAPVPGATVDGQTSGADGSVTIGPFTAGGDHQLKASKTGAIRSNSATVCVTDGADGFCNTVKPSPSPAPPAPAAASAVPDTAPALGRIAGIGEQQRFARGRGPRELRGTVADDPSGISEVRLRLTRRNGRRCETFDGVAERWVRASRCGAEHGSFFAIGNAASWSYLLPSALAKGRYVLDTQTVDGAGNVTRGADRGAPGAPRNRVVFHVG